MFCYGDGCQKNINSSGRKIKSTAKTKTARMARFFIDRSRHIYRHCPISVMTSISVLFTSLLLSCVASVEANPASVEATPATSTSSWDPNYNYNGGNDSNKYNTKEFFRDYMYLVMLVAIPSLILFGCAIGLSFVDRRASARRIQEHRKLRQQQQEIGEATGPPQATAAPATTTTILFARPQDDDNDNDNVTVATVLSNSSCDDDDGDDFKSSSVSFRSSYV